VAFVLHFAQLPNDRLSIDNPFVTRLCPLRCVCQFCFNDLLVYCQRSSDPCALLKGVFILVRQRIVPNIRTTFGRRQRSLLTKRQLAEILLGSSYLYQLHCRFPNSLWVSIQQSNNPLCLANFYRPFRRFYFLFICGIKRSLKAFYFLCV